MLYNISAQIQPDNSHSSRPGTAGMVRTTAAAPDSWNSPGTKDSGNKKGLQREKGKKGEGIKLYKKDKKKRKKEGKKIEKKLKLKL